MTSADGLSNHTVCEVRMLAQSMRREKRTEDEEREDSTQRDKSVDGSGRSP